MKVARRKRDHRVDRLDLVIVSVVLLTQCAESKFKQA